MRHIKPLSLVLFGTLLLRAEAAPAKPGYHARE